jgi:hypothetical protein
MTSVLVWLFSPLLFVTFSFSVAHAQSDASSDAARLALQNEIESARLVPAELNERCAFSGQLLPPGTSVRILRGRRLPLMPDAALEADLRTRPEKYFALVQPSGALFTESGPGEVGHYVWVYLGFGVIVLMILAGFAGQMAIRRGLEPGGWFLQGLCGNVLAPFLLRTRGSSVETLAPGHTKPHRTAMPKHCAACGNENHPSASKCSMCHASLDAAYQSEAEQLRSREK